jgi:hypothetical protein
MPKHDADGMRASSRGISFGMLGLTLECVAAWARNRWASSPLNLANDAVGKVCFSTFLES